MKTKQSRFDRVIASLLTGIMGTCFGMIPWMMDAGTWWIVGCSVLGFAMVAFGTYLFGESIERFDKGNQGSLIRTLLFDSGFGLVPALIGLLICVLVLAIKALVDAN